MCGIVGMVSKNSFGFSGKDDEIFEELLYADGLRGLDSTGCFYVTQKNQIASVKQAVEPGVFFRSDAWKAFKTAINRKARLVVGHNRFATSGEVTSKNAHPFIREGIALVHNGFIANAKNIDSTVKVDSESIITSLTTHKDNYAEGIKALNGAFAIVWYDRDKKKLFLTRNKDRPLFIAESQAKLFFASEAGMLTWILGRNGHGVREYPKMLGEDEILSVSLNPFYMDTKSLKTIVVSKGIDPDVANGEYPDTSGLGIEMDEQELVETREAARRVTEQVNKFVSSNDDNADVEKGSADLKDFLGVYPIDSTVLFEPKSWQITDKKFITYRGIVWKPGKPLYDAVWNTEYREDWKNMIRQGAPLVAKINMLSRHNDHLVVVLHEVKVPTQIMKDFVGQEVSFQEWQDICKIVACNKCAKALTPESLDFVKVGRTPMGKYESVCQACTAKIYQDSFNKKGPKDDQTDSEKPKING